MLTAVDSPRKRKRYLSPRARRAAFAQFRSDRNSILEAMDYLQAEPDLSDLVHRDHKTGELYVEGATHYMWDCVYDCSYVGCGDYSRPLFVRDKSPHWTREEPWLQSYKRDDTRYNVDGEDADTPRNFRVRDFMCDACGLVLTAREKKPGAWGIGTSGVLAQEYRPHYPHFPQQVPGSVACGGWFNPIGPITLEKE